MTAAFLCWMASWSVYIQLTIAGPGLVYTACTLQLFGPLGDEPSGRKPRATFNFGELWATQHEFGVPILYIGGKMHEST